jgi:hypothetical protein
MAHFPQFNGKTRAFRVRVPGNESVNFNLGGRHIAATLQKLSLTGGLADFPTQVPESVLAEVVLNTASGPVSALVELMKPVQKGSASRPFRFVALDDNDYQRLASTLHNMRKQGLGE